MAGLTGPAAAEVSQTAAEVTRAVFEFCLPTLRGDNPAATASALGAAQQDNLPPAQREWTERASRGTYYGFPLRKGALLFHAERQERSALCAVTLFDVAPRDVDQVYGALDSLFAAKGYERIQGRAQPGARPAGYKGDNGSLLVILTGNDKTSAKAGVQMHIMMKRRLYAF